MKKKTRRKQSKKKNKKRRNKEETVLSSRFVESTECRNMLNVQKESSKDTPDDEPNITYQDLLIDTSKHKVFLKDKKISLTAKEFTLLKYLIKRADKVQTRDNLLDKVWGYDSSVTTRTVDTHVKRLRSKLGKYGDNIETIRGVGYIFNKI